MIYVIILLIAIAIGLEFSTWVVYGSPIKREKLNVFMWKYIETYKNTVSKERKIFYGDFNMPYIAKTPASVLSKWYIGDIGTIPRWSKWSRVLDGIMGKKIKRSELINKYL